MMKMGPATWENCFLTQEAERAHHLLYFPAEAERALEHHSTHRSVFQVLGSQPRNQPSKSRLPIGFIFSFDVLLTNPNAKPGGGAAAAAATNNEYNS